MAYDPNAPSSRAALAEMQKTTVKTRVLAIARGRTRSAADGEDLVADAMILIMDPEKAPWDEAKRTFVAHISFVMKKLWDQQRRKASAQHEVLREDVSEEDDTDAREPPVDEELERRRGLAVLRRLMDEVADRLGRKHPIIPKIVDLSAQGHDEPAEQARILECPVEQVYEAMATLKYHARAVRDEWHLAERDRMASLRERARTTKDEVRA